MLKPLATLIKINKSELDQKRKQLSILLDSKQKRIDEIKKMEESIKSEAENLPNLDQDFRHMFLSYLEATRMREGILLEEIDKINPEINKVSDEISEVFSEMKKFEIVKENKENEIEQELQRKDQLEIDEIAIMNFTRKNEADYIN